MAYSYQANYQPSLGRKPSTLAELKKCGLLLLFGGIVEMVATVVTMLMVLYSNFDLYYLLFDGPVIVLSAFCMAFLVVKKTGRIGSGLLANLLLNFGYHVGAVIVVLLAFFATIPVYDGLPSLFFPVFIAIALFVCCLFLIGINFLCGLPGVWLGKWQYRRTFNDGPGVAMIAREMNQATSYVVNRETPNYDNRPAGSTSPADQENGQAHGDSQAAVSADNGEIEYREYSCYEDMGNDTN
ncbi:hypothetical protein KDH_00990 [Dictyobacter sp. S3.2.2.5]|uniref:Uncharacterized protein n=1 Tax=Dictyobacter halimunensis TaxID=3026934 RepID=A0ABQ6FI62_9CHLR|nr:hypothetical protein KDH_00990 [Dictyobacter sp. S3.2.2.5]